MAVGAPSVMTSGTTEMPVWCADSWDTLHMVIYWNWNQHVSMQLRTLMIMQCCCSSGDYVLNMHTCTNGSLVNCMLQTHFAEKGKLQHLKFRYAYAVVWRSYKFGFLFCMLSCRLTSKGTPHNLESLGLRLPNQQQHKNNANAATCTCTCDMRSYSIPLGILASSNTQSRTRATQSFGCLLFSKNLVNIYSISNDTLVLAGLLTLRWHP